MPGIDNGAPTTIQIGVIGPGAQDATAEQYDLARQVGRLLAESGACVVCGGRGGVMEGVALGVAEARGFCVGLLPGHDRSEANPYLSVAICTGIGEKRNEAVVESSDAMIAIGVNEGTAIEVILAKQRGITVFGLGVGPIVVAARRLDGVVPVPGPVKAVERALEAARSPRWAGARQRWALNRCAEPADGVDELPSAPDHGARDGQ